MTSSLSLWEGLFHETSFLDTDPTSQVQWATTELDGVVSESGVQRRGDRGYQLPTKRLPCPINHPVSTPEFPEFVVDQSTVHHHDDYNTKWSGTRDTLSVDTQATFSGVDPVKGDKTKDRKSVV